MDPYSECTHKDTRFILDSIIFLFQTGNLFASEATGSPLRMNQISSHLMMEDSFPSKGPTGFTLKMVLHLFSNLNFDRSFSLCCCRCCCMCTIAPSMQLPTLDPRKRCMERRQQLTCGTHQSKWSTSLVYPRYGCSRDHSTAQISTA